MISGALLSASIILGQATTAPSPSLEERALLAIHRSGRGQPDWSHVESWAANGVLVILFKEPAACEADRLQELGRTASVARWTRYRLRILDGEVSRIPDDRASLASMRTLIAIQGPSGTGCGWREMRPREDWSSVPLMVQNGRTGACSEMLEAISGLPLGADTHQSIRESLARPRRLEDCLEAAGGR